MENQSTRDVKTAPARDKSTAARMVDHVDAQRRPVAATLEHTASALNDRADHVAGAAHSAAGKLRVTADYIRGNDVRAMAKDAGGFVGRYPAQSLLAAAVVGFVIAQIVRPRMRTA